MKRYILLLLIAIPVVFIIFGCNLNAVSIDERISMFKQAMESENAGDMASHIHPDNSMKGTLNTLPPWNPPLEFSSESYSFGSISGSGSTRTAIVSSTDSAYDSETFTFTMKEELPDVWYIDRLHLSGYNDYIF